MPIGNVRFVRMSCDSDSAMAAPAAADVAADADADADAVAPERIGAVYVMTNDLDNNEIAVFGRMADGKLYSVGNYATGGAGSTDFDGMEGLDPLISADSIVVTEDEEYLCLLYTSPSPRD